jgi:putative addiction module component (TIGR02574 family)
MSPPLQKLKAALFGLPVAERAELAQFLLHTLEPAEEGAAEKWWTLAERRMAEVRAGQVVGIPAEQVLESLRVGRGGP